MFCGDRCALKQPTLTSAGVRSLQCDSDESSLHQEIYALAQCSPSIFDPLLWTPISSMFGCRRIFGRCRKGILTQNFFNGNQFCFVFKNLNKSPSTSKTYKHIVVWCFYFHGVRNIKLFKERTNERTTVQVRPIPVQSTQPANNNLTNKETQTAKITLQLLHVNENQILPIKYHWNIGLFYFANFGQRTINILFIETLH